MNKSEENTKQHRIHDDSNEEPIEIDDSNMHEMMEEQEMHVIGRQGSNDSNQSNHSNHSSNHSNQNEQPALQSARQSNPSSRKGSFKALTQSQSHNINEPRRRNSKNNAENEQGIIQAGGAGMDDTMEKPQMHGSFVFTCFFFFFAILRNFFLRNFFLRIFFCDFAILRVFKLPKTQNINNTHTTTTTTT